MNNCVLAKFVTTPPPVASVHDDLPSFCAGAPGLSQTLSAVLKALRRRRGLRVQEAADRMGLRKRTYEAFEAGAGGLAPARIQAFAAALDVDPAAIVLAVLFDSPDFALACADNKLALAALLTLRDFHKDTGADVARLDPRVVFRELDAAWTRLHEEARRRRPPGSGMS